MNVVPTGLFLKFLYFLEGVAPLEVKYFVILMYGRPLQTQ